MGMLLLLPLLLYLLPQLSSQPVTTLPPIPVPTPAPVITTSEPYDCKSQGLWSFDKKGWCCKHYGVGCPTTPPPTPAPPPPPPPPAPISTTSPCPFDCNAGYNEWPNQWVKGWSGAKKLYCCKTAGRGCPSELPPPSGLPPSGIPGETDIGPYDCNAGYHPCYHCLVHQWSPMKLRWCCTNQKRLSEQYARVRVSMGEGCDFHLFSHPKSAASCAGWQESSSLFAPSSKARA